VRASARIDVAWRDGRSEVVGRAAEAPMSVRRCGSRVLIAAAAAAPVGGDELRIDVTVGEHARADIGTVAATLVWPSPVPAWSSTATTCQVGEWAHLVWWPEPTVSVDGSLHRATTLVRLAATATCTMVEEVGLGRSGEPSGVLELDLRVERNGPLLHHCETFGVGSSSVGVGGARHAVSAVIVGPAAGDPRTEVTAATAAAWLPIAPDAAVLLAVGPDRPAVWEVVDRVAPCLRRPSHRPERSTMVRPSDQTTPEVHDARGT
jgi:urease accessory protein